MFLFTSDLHLGKGGCEDVSRLEAILRVAKGYAVPVVFGGDVFDKTADIEGLYHAVEKIRSYYKEVIAFFVEGNHETKNPSRYIIPGLLNVASLDHNPVEIDGETLVGSNYQNTADWEITIPSVPSADCLVCHQTLGGFAPEYHACVKDIFLRRYAMVLAGDWHYRAEYTDPVTGSPYLSAGPGGVVFIESIRRRAYRFL